MLPISREGQSEDAERSRKRNGSVLAGVESLETETELPACARAGGVDLPERRALLCGA